MNRIHMNLGKSLNILCQAPFNACTGLSQQLELFQKIAWKKKKSVLKKWRVKTLGHLVCWPLPEWRFPHPAHCESILRIHCG